MCTKLDLFQENLIIISKFIIQFLKNIVIIVEKS
jgi:hypothetical protein